MSKQGAGGRTAEAKSDAVARAKSVVEMLQGAAERIEAARALPTDVTAALHEAKMFRLLLPRSLGGDELHLKTHAQVMEAVSYTHLTLPTICSV